ncbi:MAG TPA: DUF695 domain-containing protein [Niastella sp.]
MSFFKNLFSKKEDPINSYTDFWTWFQLNESTFLDTVKNRSRIEKDFLNKLSPKLGELTDGLFFLTGMNDDNIAELIFTPDGNIKKIAFVEELVQAAPELPGWKFIACKPAFDQAGMRIKMDEYVFEKDNLFFYSNDHPDYPDEIDITIVYSDFYYLDEATIVNGTHIFIDNLLGELNAVTIIDNIKVIGKEGAEKELVPIDKLKDFLVWRQKEFLEKYEDQRHDTEHDSYSCLEATLKNGRPLIAIVNTALLDWDAKAIHPWIMTYKTKYYGNKNNGMPDAETLQLMTAFEDDISAELKDAEGYLNIARETADNKREVYYACKDFRKPSTVLPKMIEKYAGITGRLNITFDIYKDKYWKSFDRFRPNE